MNLPFGQTPGNSSCPALQILLSSDFQKEMFLSFDGPLPLSAIIASVSVQCDALPILTGSP